ncbi:MAG: PP2C family protein-serine/threonine phosphatase [Actinomycetota bacterium]
MTVRLLARPARSGGLASTAEKTRETGRETDASPEPGLIPRRLPHIPGLEVEAGVLLVLEAPPRAGGDFVDVFALDGAYCIAYGDICGNDPEVATLATMSKQTLRALAQRDPSPESVAHELGRTLFLKFGGQRTLSLVYACYDPASRRLAFSNCGAWPPMLLTSRHARLFEECGPRLGEHEFWRYPVVDLTLTPGEVFVGYTDGIPEARRGREILGIGPIQHTLEHHPRDSAPTLARRLLRLASEYARGPTMDDAVVVVARALTAA